MAVYTQVSDDELADFIAKFNIGELVSYKGIAEGVENTNYIVHTTSGPFILTLYEKRVSEADLPYFLGLMDHLSTNGVICPTPVKDKNGVALGELAGRKAVIVTFLEGFCIRRPQPDHCLQLGSALAQLHLAGNGFERHRTNALGLSGWRPLYNRFYRDADSIVSGVHDLISRELDTLDNDWPSALPTGIIHADLFPDNVFFLKDKLSGLIDFYFACNDAFAYDVAICLNAWCFEPDFSFNVTKGRALLRGYEKVRQLSTLERTSMPTLARGAALRFLLTRCYDWLNTPANAVVSPHNPVDYVRRLRFHQRINSIVDYGYKPLT